MDDVRPFALTVTLGCAVLLLAVLSNRLSERLRVPAPAFFLIGAALASDVFPSLYGLSVTTVQRLVTVCLLVILFDGGMHIGMRRFRAQAAPILWLGLAGTLVTAAALAVVAHEAFGFGWTTALLLGTALSPTDPAVVFSVLGRREVSGASGTLLEGESGANDPVGIALLVSILAAARSGGALLDGVGAGLAEFALQMGVGALVGVLGGRALLAFASRVPLPSEGLYPLRVLGSAGLVFGVATLLHGSGFLAVFVAGILVGDERAPYKREIERFTGSLASLAEIVAFALLGLTVHLDSLGRGNAWQIGLAIAVLLAFVVRPVLVGLVLWPLRLAARERVFVLWAGLKGAVPVLLGTYVLAEGGPDALRVYDVVVVVVAFSVVVQGGLVPAVASRLRLPMRVVDPEPWSLGLRFRDEPHGIHRYTVGPGAPADGCQVGDLPLGENAWISLVSRDGGLVQVRGETRLAAGDEVLVLADPVDAAGVSDLFLTGR